MIYFEYTKKTCDFMKKDLRQAQLQSVYDHLRSIGRIHTQKDLAERIGSRPESISQALSGSERYLTDNLFKKLALEFGDVFSRTWLETGEGEMLVSQSVSGINQSTVVGNNVKGNGIHINNSSESEAVALLRVQLQEKEAEIVRLHAIIDKLLNQS